MNIHLVACEESGDRLGAALIHALRAKCTGAVHFSGVGGQAMAVEGVQSWFAIDELSIMGFAAVLRSLRSIMRRIDETADAIIAGKPDALVIIDSPEFTHRVARRVRRVLPGIPIIDYVSPSVWAWRPGRARAMRAYIDHVLAVLPFEPSIHERLGGPSCTYIGHPLVQQLSQLRPNEDEACRRAVAPPVVLVLPGSRRVEIRQLIEPFRAAIALAAERAGPLELVMPTVESLYEELLAVTSDWVIKPRIICRSDEKYAAFRIAHVALAASGTVTLELALASVPTVAAYRGAGWEAAIARRLIQVPSIILANLVVGENVVPEFLQERCTPLNLCDALLQLIDDTPARRLQLTAFAKLDAIMNAGAQKSPSEKAAEIVLGLVARRQEEILPSG